MTTPMALLKADSTYTFKIFRYDSKTPEKEPSFSTYQVDVVPGMSVLSALLAIRDEMDGGLSFRCSCRSAVCGSCAMAMNGKIELACRTQVASLGSDLIILEPLPNFEIIKDLVVDMIPFWAKYDQIKPWLIRKTLPVGTEIRQSEEERNRIDQFVHCILCAACYGACPVPSRDPEYLGPAALAKLERFVLDSRDERSPSALEAVNNEKGVWGCDTLFKCIEACPKDVRPTDAIVGLRKSLVKHKFKKLLGMVKDED
ncbi:MAG: succinate dehydrogenase iron-sulfur subunit [Deltaproteobacteria bacterium]|nr:succinate dehydrogenase iron-sulfur subunit [Deltaproteobacteria bacterium]